MAGLLLVVAAGCGAAPPASPCEVTEAIQVHFTPLQQLNPDREGYPRSVVTRVYQLEGEQGFEAHEYDAIWQQGGDGSALVAPMVAAPEELTLIPGRDDQRVLKRHPKATHVAVIAKFREHAPYSAWRAVARLPPPSNPCETPAGPRFTVELANYSVRFR